jgi:hypothetical protein
MRSCGIDVGQQGAVALLADGKFSRLVDIPVDSSRELDSLALFHLLLEWEPDLVVFENIFRPNQTIRFAGEVQAVCKILQVESLMVAITSWKTAVLGRNTSDKKVSVDRCRELFPDADLIRPGCRVSNPDRAEALLLAYYGSELRGGGTRK